MGFRAAIPILAVLPWACAGQENNSNDAVKGQAGVVTSSSRGLHGYISYSASRPGRMGGGAWGNPGPKHGPYTVDLADGS